MPAFGFPAQLRLATMSLIVADIRSRGDDARIAAVTGRHADVTNVLGGRVGDLMHVEKSISDLARYAEAIALSEARAATMQTSLATLGAVGQALADTTSVVLTNGTDANLASLSTQARGDLDTVTAALNVTFAGRALFAGDDAGGATLAGADTVYSTSVPFLESATSASAAYATLQAEFLGAGGNFESAFYLGGSNRAPLTEVAPGERVDYTVTADEAAIRKFLFNAVVLAAAYDTANGIPAGQRRPMLQLAADGMRAAVSQLASLQGRLGAAEARIAVAKARNVATEAALTVQFNARAGADEYEAAVSLTQLDRQLETAYAATARLSNLSLTKFL